MICVNAFDSICHGKSHSKTDLKSKHMEGIIAAENEKEMLTRWLTKRTDENLLWSTHPTVTQYINRKYKNWQLQHTFDTHLL